MFNLQFTQAIQKVSTIRLNSSKCKRHCSRAQRCEDVFRKYEVKIMKERVIYLLNEDRIKSN
jgi:hypothetical protein